MEEGKNPFFYCIKRQRTSEVLWIVHQVMLNEDYPKIGIKSCVSNVKALEKSFELVTDMSTLACLQHTQSLDLLDELYLKVIRHGFCEDVCQARLETFRSPGAFSIFVKTNTVLNYELLLKESLNQPQKDYYLQLRKFSSIQVLSVLQYFLRPTSIREANSSMRLGMVRVLAMTLEQVLDTASQSGAKLVQQLYYKDALTKLAIVLGHHLYGLCEMLFGKSSPLLDVLNQAADNLTGVELPSEFWDVLAKELITRQSLIPVRSQQCPETNTTNAYAEGDPGREDCSRRSDVVLTEYPMDAVVESGSSSIYLRHTHVEDSAPDPSTSATVFNLDGTNLGTTVNPLSEEQSYGSSAQYVPGLSSPQESSSSHYTSPTSSTVASSSTHSSSIVPAGTRGSSTTSSSVATHGPSEIYHPRTDFEWRSSTPPAVTSVGVEQQPSKKSKRSFLAKARDRATIETWSSNVFKASYRFLPKLKRPGRTETPRNSKGPQQQSSTSYEASTDIPREKLDA